MDATTVVPYAWMHPNVYMPSDESLQLDLESQLKLGPIIKVYTNLVAGQGHRSFEISQIKSEHHTKNPRWNTVQYTPPIWVFAEAIPQNTLYSIEYTICFNSTSTSAKPPAKYKYPTQSHSTRQRKA